MILAVDVDYSDDEGHAAGVLFRNWEDPEPERTVVVKIESIHEYIPGQFYKRELPCIMELLDKIQETIACIVVDGYVYLSADEKPGLGKYLYDELGSKIPVIGVAKSSFVDTPPNCEVLRGSSSRPLYVTAAGLDKESAKAWIKSMHGEYRFPTLLKEVDALCRSWR